MCLPALNGSGLKINICMLYILLKHAVISKNYLSNKNVTVTVLKKKKKKTQHFYHFSSGLPFPICF